MSASRPNKIRSVPDVTVEPEEIVETAETVEPERLSITINEPRWLTKPRKFLARNLPKVGIFVVGAAAGAAALILTSSGDDDEELPAELTAGSEVLEMLGPDGRNISIAPADYVVVDSDPVDNN